MDSHDGSRQPEARFPPGGAVEPPHDPAGADNWRDRLHTVIFEAETPAGKAFDLALLVAILVSVAAVCLESVEAYRRDWGGVLRVVEWTFTLLFTVEYALRLLCVRYPWRYARSFFGVVDLLAILPTYLSLVVAGTQSLIVIRALRLLRIFRVLKLMHFVGEGQMLQAAIKASMRKIIIFIGTVLTLVLIIGALMYLIEGEANGFTSIPISIYWAIVTLTTVGYGDIAPQTVVGKLLASAVMVIGYGIIAVPTGIVTVELAEAARVNLRPTRACPGCGVSRHDHDAIHCKYCGTEL